MATFYYDNATEDFSWFTLGNWRMDNNTPTRIPAVNLPSSSDDVVILAYVGFANSSDTVTINNITTYEQVNGFAGSTMNILGYGTFYSYSVGMNFIGNITIDGTFFESTVTGDVILQNGSNTSMFVVGNATLYDTCFLEGGATGTITLNDYSGILGGAAIIVLNDFATISYFTETNSVTFNDDSYNSAIIYASMVVFNNNAYNEDVIVGSVIFNDNSYTSGGGIESGNIVFNDNSYSTSTEYYQTNITFNDNSYAFHHDTIYIDTSINVAFNGYTGVKNIDGVDYTFNGGSLVLYYNAAIDENWNTLGNWWTNSSHSIPSPILPDWLSSVVLNGSCCCGNPTVFNFTFASDLGSYYSSLSLSVLNIMEVYGLGFMDSGSITVYGTAIFYDNSSSAAEITGETIFYDNSSNDYTGIIYSYTIFNDNSRNYGSIETNATFNDAAWNVGFINNLSDASNIFNAGSVNAGQVIGDTIFNYSTNDSGAVYGDAIFNNSIIYGGGIDGNCILNGLSQIDGFVYGDLTLNDNSYIVVATDAQNIILNDASYISFSYPPTLGNIGTLTLGTRTPYPLRLGINNSDILGIL
jgi:hypothetical protein